MLIASADSGSLAIGFTFILIAAVAGGAFGLQYRIMRTYTVENSSLLSLSFATIVVPLIAVQFIFWHRSLMASVHFIWAHWARRSAGA